MADFRARIPAAHRCRWQPGDRVRVHVDGVAYERTVTRVTETHRGTGAYTVDIDFDTPLPGYAGQVVTGLCSLDADGREQLKTDLA